MPSHWKTDYVTHRRCGTLSSSLCMLPVAGPPIYNVAVQEFCSVVVVSVLVVFGRQNCRILSQATFRPVLIFPKPYCALASKGSLYCINANKCFLMEGKLCSKFQHDSRARQVLNVSLITSVQAVHVRFRVLMRKSGAHRTASVKLMIFKIFTL